MISKNNCEGHKKKQMLQFRKCKVGDIYQQGQRWIRFYLLFVAFNRC